MALSGLFSRAGAQERVAPAGTVTLPAPARGGTISLEETLHRRRSLREFRDAELTPAQIGQLLWAAQGVTGPGGLRTAPSAGALYPLEIYVATPAGLYHYQAHSHRLTLHTPGDPRPPLRDAALGQDAVGAAPAVFVVTAVVDRAAAKYGARAERYVQLEAGHAAQNLLLQAVALGLGGVPVGAFHDDAVRAALRLPRSEQPLYLIPVGHPRGRRTG
jgi:SagB-type dehydrogenase family enzyme